MTRFNYESNRELWTTGRDPEQAVADCKLLLSAVVAGSIDPLEQREDLVHSFDVVLDGPGGDDALVMRALRIFLAACDAAAKATARPMTGDERLELRITSSVLSAIVHHRLGYPREALSRAYTALIELEQSVGGEYVLLEALGSVRPNATAELAVATTTILAATLRRVDLPRDTRQLLVDRCRRLYGAYALHGRDPVIYPRTSALAVQLLFLLAEEGNPNDRPLVEALKRLDAQTRPAHRRGQATLALCEHAYACYAGDTKAAATIAKTALDSIKRFPLPRHLIVISAQDYLRGAPAAGFAA